MTGRNTSRRYPGMSIQHRLIIFGLMITAFGLSIFGLGMTATEVSIVQKNMLRELTVQARIIGENCTAALVFDDPKSARETLGALRANAMIDYCILYTADGKPFATYSRAGGGMHGLIPLSAVRPDRFGIDHVAVNEQIVLDGKRLGTVYIQANLDGLYASLLYFVTLLLLAVLLALGAAYAASRRMQKTITDPIMAMAWIMKSVSEEKDYSVRMPHERTDELDLLARGFNDMLSQIQVRDAELQAHRNILQSQVEARTADLQKSNERLIAELDARYEAERLVRHEKEQAQMYLDIAGVAIVAIAANETVIRVNRKCCQMLGYDEHEIVGRDWFALFLPEREREEIRQIFGRLIAGQIENVGYVENSILTRTGEERLIAWNNTVIRDETGAITAVLSSGEDITQRRRMENDLKQMNRQLEALAVTDGLTGLYNHRYFYDRLGDEIKRSQRFGHPLSMIILDIDFFKHYNDTRGHLCGDEVLRQIAGCIRSSIRDQDIPARYGGEEFTVILPETGRESVSQIAERVRRTIEVYPFAYKEGQPNGNLTVSLGCATYPDDANNPVDLAKCADDALYRAKQTGRNRVEQALSVPL